MKTERKQQSRTAMYVRVYGILLCLVLMIGMVAASVYAAGSGTYENVLKNGSFELCIRS